jgi:hypothetical protein
MILGKIPLLYSPPLVLSRAPSITDKEAAAYRHGHGINQRHLNMFLL